MRLPRYSRVKNSIAYRYTVVSCVSFHAYVKFEIGRASADFIQIEYKCYIINVQRSASSHVVTNDCVAIS